MRILHTPRVLLRPFEETDAAEFYEYASDPRVGLAAGWKPHESVEESRHIIQTVFSDRNTFAVVDKASGKVIGSAGFTGRSGSSGVTSDEIGYSLSVAWWGRGIMTEVVRELLRFGFEERGLREIWCTHYAENDRSRRVIEKCGFQHIFTQVLSDNFGEHTVLFYMQTKEIWQGGTYW